MYIEAYSWLLILFAWLLLLGLGLTGGDVMAADHARSEAPAREERALQPTESGLHAVA